MRRMPQRQDLWDKIGAGFTRPQGPLNRRCRSSLLRLALATLHRDSRERFVNLGSQLTDSSHEQRPIPLPRTPLSVGNHRLCRMGLPSLSV